MHKKVSTKKRIFLSLVGQTGSAKSYPIFDWLKIDSFQPAFDAKLLFLYKLFIVKCKEKTYV